ncbi:hypothetical protein Prudu_005649 [Prunus dulcis]|uniref:NB-ARC domain-containing disease resistance protein n=1 Tax=Prunus dulcis TaxID=3755 RepID=A0A4Y1QY09_PRUDU|nr:hypothetical protein Prudu_005649 [Prunus dulcis]
MIAFGTNKPPKDYLELAQRGLEYAQGIPLALTLLGSHLRNKDKDRWQDILDSYEGDHIQVSRDCIEELIEKAMITIDDGRIQMHDLLEKLGKHIVHEESPNDPGKRSRLWFYEDVEQVLTENTGTRNIQGIMVKLPNPAEITLNPECFRNMINLEIFINRNASLCGHINYLPNTLRLIDWDRCQLQSLPPNFHGNRLVEFNMPNGCQLQSLPPNFQGNHLVEFNMPRSHIRQLDGFKQSPNLTTMNLSGCQFLEKIPDLSGIPNLKYLNLSGCEMLESFPEIEVEMESLRFLNLSGSGVRELPPSIAYLTGLLQLDLRGCFNLTKFATLRLKYLRFLDLSDCKSLESDEVPKWFSYCKDAIRRGLSYCYSYYDEVSFEIPPNLKWETLRLVLCVVTIGSAKILDGYAEILLNGKLVNFVLLDRGRPPDEDIEVLGSHVYLKSIPLFHDDELFEEPPTKQVNTCQVIFHLKSVVPAPFKIPLGVHLLGHHVADVSETDVVYHGPTQLLPDAMAVDDDIYDNQHQDCELLSLSLASKTSLGKRPRQSDYMALHDDHRANVVDIGDHEAEGLTLFTGPSDHQKRRHIDLNEEPKNDVPKWFMQAPGSAVETNPISGNGLVIKRNFDNPAKSTKWDLEQLKLQDEKFDG